MKLEKLIAKGRYNEVYKSGDLVVKVFNEGYKKEDVFTEALLAASVEPLGLNIPAVKEVTQIDGKWAISMECVEGKTLSKLMEEDPANVDKYVEQMVDIQINMFAKKCPSLRSLKEKLTKKISQVIQSALGISAKIKLMGPNSLTRSEGKAVHVIDKRKLY